MDILYFYIVSKVTINALSIYYLNLFVVIYKKIQYLNINFAQKNWTLMQGKKNANYIKILIQDFMQLIMLKRIIQKS